MRSRRATTDRLGAIALGVLVLLAMLAPCLAFAAGPHASSSPEGSSFRDLSTAALGSAHRVLQGDGFVRVEPLPAAAGAEAGALPPAASAVDEGGEFAPDREPSASRSPVRRF